MIVTCPWCGEPNEIVLDPQTSGELVQDCEVCCRPWAMTVGWTARGAPRVTVERG